jgi:hypothetical protein
VLRSNIAGIAFDDEFVAAVSGLATSSLCSFRPFSFETGSIEREAREVRVDRPVLVEGVSALHSDLTPFV